MKNIQKRRSVFRSLRIKIFVIVIVLNIVQAVINIENQINLQNINENERKQNIKNEIINISDFLSSAVESIEKTIYYSHKNAIKKLLDLSVNNDLKFVDLTSYFSFLNLDTINNDLYIIENGKIVNTTFDPDLGLDFYNYGENYKRYLQKIQNNGDFFLEKFAIEVATKRLKSYSYQPTLDKKYIIEIGSYSNAVDNILNLFTSKLKEIVIENKDILSANIWLGWEKPVSMIEDTFFVASQDSLLFEVFKSKSDIQHSFKRNSRNLLAEYMLVEVKNQEYFFDSFIISIIKDVTNKNKPIYKIIAKQLIYTFLFLILILIVIYWATGNLKSVMNDLMKKIGLIADGSLHERIKVEGDNEFTSLAEHFNHMLEQLETSHNDLNRSNDLLAQRNEEITAQRNYALEQKEIIKKQASKILDNIQYAQRIQKAVLPPEENLNEIIPQHFVIYIPKDIVSGDFYLVKKIKNFIIVITADCTGHGVSGAFMSMLGVAFLNEIVSRTSLDKPGEILDRLRNKIKSSLRQKGKQKETTDGMDIALYMINTENMEMQFSGAYEPLYIVRDQNIIEYKGDRQPVAIYLKEKEFTTHIIDLKKGDTIYTLSDGFTDQIGGKEKKRYLPKRFKKLILEINHKPMAEQKEILEDIFMNWKKDLPQTDDVLVIGVKI